VNTSAQAISERNSSVKQLKTPNRLGFKDDWDRWSAGERLAATITMLVSGLAASVMLMNGL